MPSNVQPAVVLCLSGHDPSGGAGIHADIEAVAAQGCHAATVITCLTLQDTLNVRELAPVSTTLFKRQVRLINQDYTIAAIKIGLLGSPLMAATVMELLGELNREGGPLPVVLDPVLAAGGGAELGRQELVAEIQQMLPRITLLTPNRQEARRFTGTEDISDAANLILAAGCQAVLVTGADEADGDMVINQLYQQHHNHQWRYPKLTGQYHGSGCTLAASIAARLALGEPLRQALATAQDYTYQTLLQATNPGRGQSIPHRMLCTS